MHTHPVTLIGLGAIGSSVFDRMQSHPTVRITHVVVSERRLAEAQSRLERRRVGSVRRVRHGR